MSSRRAQPADALAEGKDADESASRAPGKKLTRIGVAIDEDLLVRFDDLIHSRGYQNRSEAFRDLIREQLVEEKAASPDQEVVGSLTLVYDHHVRMLSDKLLNLQHDHHEEILSTLHVHLDHDNCLEVMLIRGVAERVNAIADQLISTKGVRHGKLTIAAAGVDL